MNTNYEAKHNAILFRLLLLPLLTKKYSLDEHCPQTDSFFFCPYE
jgi:hypothetical protein